MNFDDILIFEDDDKQEPVSEKEPTVSKKQIYETVDCLSTYFEGKKSIGKADMEIYSGKTSILGTKIRSIDKIIEVALINAQSADTSNFISISFKKVLERDIKDVAKKYVCVSSRKRYPLIVERKYMEQKQYKNIRKRILEEM